MSQLALNGLTLLFPSRRKADGKGRSVSERTHDAELAIHLARKTAADREPEPESALHSRARGGRTGHLNECVEDPLDVIRRNSFACVADVNQRAFVRPRARYCDASAL